MLVMDKGNAPALGGTDWWDSLTSNLNSEGVTSLLSKTVSGVSSIFSSSPVPSVEASGYDPGSYDNFFTDITSGGITARTQPSGFDWDALINNIGKAVDVGSTLWSGAANKDIQIAQLELAKTKAETEQARLQAQKLIDATRTSQLATEAANTEKAIVSRTMAGVSLGTIAVIGLGAYLLLSRKGKR